MSCALSLMFRIKTYVTANMTSYHHNKLPGFTFNSQSVPVKIQDETELINVQYYVLYLRVQWRVLLICHCSVLHVQSSLAFFVLWVRQYIGLRARTHDSSVRKLVHDFIRYIRWFFSGQPATKRAYQQKIRYASVAQACRWDLELSGQS